MTAPEATAGLREYRPGAREALRWKLEGLGEAGDAAWSGGYRDRVEQAARSGASR